jgi:2-dehydropantoate 2-reductase
MKIAVIGAGAIGSVLGGLMARAGVDVTLIGRQSQVSAIHRNGLAIDGALGSFVIRVPAHEKLDFVPDLAILAVKTQNIAEALRENQFYIQAAPVMTLQNGARADQMVADIIGGERLYSGVVLFGATYLEPGKVTYATAGRLIIGKPFGDPDPETLRQIAETLGKAMPTSTTTTISGAHWAKLIVNENNALPAITGLSIQEVNRIPELRKLSVLLMKETLNVFRASGIVPAALPALPIGLVTLLLRMPVVLAQVVPILGSRSLGQIPVLGSTLQSVKRGEKTEIDYLNGEVVALGKRTGTPTPYNTAVVSLVHQVEDQHQFLSVEQLLAALNAERTRLSTS